jgi:hypothetical protein
MSELYKASFAQGSKVRVAAPAVLENFRKTWKYHHPLQPEQLQFAGAEAVVKSVGFYHGGDPLYELEDIPGIWNEPCLESAG